MADCGVSTRYSLLAVTPAGGELTLETPVELRAEYFLANRELGFISAAAPGPSSPTARPAKFRTALVCASTSAPAPRCSAPRPHVPAARGGSARHATGVQHPPAGGLGHRHVAETVIPRWLTWKGAGQPRTHGCAPSSQLPHLLFDTRQWASRAVDAT